ncbi:hypothetical protein AB7187_20480, partial [Providencia rettgeri]
PYRGIFSDLSGIVANNNLVFFCSEHIGCFRLKRSVVVQQRKVLMCHSEHKHACGVSIAAEPLYF